jgi:accessory gene regulator B
MKQDLSECVVKELIKDHIVSADDKELYQYGFQQAAFMLLNISTTILVGAIFNAVWESIVFLLVYIPLRSYAGGYHAKSPRTCYLLSILLTAGTLFGIMFIPWNNASCLLTVVGASLAMLLLAPVENSNKRLRPTEKMIYKKRVRIIVAVLIGMTALSWMLKIRQFMACIAMSMTVLAVLLLLGAAKKLLFEER